MAAWEPEERTKQAGEAGRIMRSLERSQDGTNKQELLLDYHKNSKGNMEIPLKFVILNFSFGLNEQDVIVLISEVKLRKSQSKNNEFGYLVVSAE